MIDTTIYEPETLTMLPRSSTPTRKHANGSTGQQPVGCARSTPGEDRVLDGPASDGKGSKSRQTVRLWLPRRLERIAAQAGRQHPRKSTPKTQQRSTRMKPRPETPLCGWAAAEMGGPVKYSVTGARSAMRRGGDLGEVNKACDKTRSVWPLRAAAIWGHAPCRTRPSDFT